jgi:hypothetical protein
MYDTVRLKDVRLTTLVVEMKLVLHILKVFVASVIRHAKRMRRIVLSSVASTALSHFSTLSQTARFSGGKKSYWM